MTDTLRPLPCPFCGGPGTEPSDDHYKVVKCAGKRRDNPRFVCAGESGVTSIDAWNRRPNSERDRLREAVVEAAEVLAEKAECLRDPACDEAFYQQGNCEVCEASEAIVDALAAFESSQKEDSR